jgi:hypothetical protein
LVFNQSDNSIFIGYGYGFLAVFIISILSLGGLLAFPFIYKISFQYVLATFTALAVGTLFGDAMFHLIPFVCINLSRKQIKSANCVQRNHFFSYRHLVFIVTNRMNMGTKKTIRQRLFLFINGECSPLSWVSNWQAL